MVKASVEEDGLSQRNDIKRTAVYLPPSAQPEHGDVMVAAGQYFGEEGIGLYSTAVVAAGFR